DEEPGYDQSNDVGEAEAPRDHRDQACGEEQHSDRGKSDAVHWRWHSRSGLSCNRCSCIVLPMAKPKSRYVCQSCGSVSHRWQGQWPDGSGWNKMMREGAE